jgi:hypothetical protein
MSTYFEDQPTGDDQPGADAQQSDGQSPLLLNDMQSPEEMYAAPKPSQRPRQAVVGVILTLGAIGAIFAMRQVGMGPAVSFADIDIDYKPNASATGPSPRRVLADLERSRRAIQVPADNITQDPFELSLDRTAEPDEVDPNIAQRAELERLAQLREARTRELDRAIAELDLQSVMGGSVPIARISGKVYKVGMPVGDHFTVASIDGRQVTLAADDIEFVLTMDNNG